MKFNIGIPIELELLIKSRLLIQANSGGGKSYAIRKLLEETNGKVQQIVLDLEGEFSSLREKCDFLLFGTEGDYPVQIKYADKIAKTLLELNVSAIVDLYELKHHERITFVKRFLDAMINAPKDLWHSCIVVIDEAHLFCPEKGQAESMSAVIDICTRGRKRGFCAVLATQRLSKLHKDAAAECNNKLIGRTGLDVDMKRASDELGFTAKADMLSLRDLQAGEFFSFGPAINNHIVKFRVDKVKTTHPESGKKINTVAPPSNKIKEALSKIKELPEEAEKELKELADYKKEIQSLRTKLTQAQKQQPVIDTAKIHELKTDLKKTEDKINKMKKVMENVMKFIIEITTHNFTSDIPKEEIEKAILSVTQNATKLIQEKFSNRISEFEKYKKDANALLKSMQSLLNSDINIKLDIKHNEPFSISRAPIKSNNNMTVESGRITGGALRMLKAAAMFYPESITKARMGAIAGLSFTSGSFGTYLATLKRNALLNGDGNNFTITQDGMDLVGEVEPLPDNLVEMWCNIVKGGASRMLKVLADTFPNSMSKEELGEASEISCTSGTFGTYLATLKRNGLIKVHGGQIKAAEELF